MEPMAQSNKEFDKSILTTEIGMVQNNRYLSKDEKVAQISKLQMRINSLGVNGGDPNTKYDNARMLGVAGA